MGTTFWAPGRVNLIGDHTDYSDGLVLPVAVDRGLRLEVQPDDAIALTSDREPQAVTVPADGSETPPEGWGRYVAAVAAELHALGRPPVGLRGHLTADLPSGAGLSSSASLEVVVGLALCTAAEFELDRLDLARACQRAEQRAVGVPCGIMDQAAAVLGARDHAVLLDCATLAHSLVPLPKDLALVVIDSNVSRRLEDSAYGRRRAELEEALVALHGRSPATVDPAEVADIVARAGLDDVPARRLRHVVTENARVRAAAEVLPDSDRRAELRALFADSHASLRQDFEVTVPETDLLVELCLEAGAVAARMTGGGFGGAVVALADAAHADELGEAVARSYGERQDRCKASVHQCRAGDGAALLG